MIKASVCTIGDEILIGQIIDTNTALISSKLNEAGIRISRKVSIGDDPATIKSFLKEELENNDIVITTGGLGPTGDDLTKQSLFELTGAAAWLCSVEQAAVNREILHSRGLDTLMTNTAQAMYPDSGEVIVNRVGTAPILVFRLKSELFPNKPTLYAMPGVPHETATALTDVLDDIKHHFNLPSICHKSIMTYGMAESALEQRIKPWVKALDEDMHLAYLPNTLTGVKLRLSIYGAADRNEALSRIETRFAELHSLLGNIIYSDGESNLESVVGKLLAKRGETLSIAESCTGGEISHLITTVAGSSAYYLGSVTSYAIPVKEKLLSVKDDTILRNGVVSSAVAVEMAEGVRNLTGSTYSLATTGWADSYGDEHEPAGTVWIAVSGPAGSVSRRAVYHNDRKRNIERFAATALNMLRLYILGDI